MIFSSGQFFGFYAIVFALYWLLPTRRARHTLLFLASCYFYMAWNAWMITVVLGITVWDYALALGIAGTRRETLRRALLTLSVIGNLGLLAVFKYADFLILSLRDLLLTIGLPTSLHSLHIILPVGISFHIFQTLSYTVDVYRGDIRPTRSFIDFGLFVTFFPQLVAGPIVRAKEFLPQLETLKRFDWGRIESGTVLFLIGLTKKLFIADQLAPIVDRVFADPSAYGTLDLWLAMFGYGAQIYCDFSGYSDMALAVAGMLGFDLPLNFRNPYLAAGITDFWHRWHISLSTWLRDNLYIPLGGSRGGPGRTYRNLMLTMLLGGLWHGASWTFVIWGAIHGAVLVCDRAWRRTEAPATGPAPNTAAPRHAALVGRFVSWAATLLIVHVAWVFFRCQPIPLSNGDPEPLSAALARAAEFVWRLFAFRSNADCTWLAGRPTLILLVGLMFALQVRDELRRRGRQFPTWPIPVAAAGYAAWLVILVVLAPDNTNPFIYFQF